MSEKTPYVWVCGACGRTSKDRYAFDDPACFLNAVKCHEGKRIDPETGKSLWWLYEDDAPPPKA